MGGLIPDEAQWAALQAMDEMQRLHESPMPVLLVEAGVNAAAPFIARAAQIAILCRVKDEIVAGDSAWDVADRIEDMVVDPRAAAAAALDDCVVGAQSAVRSLIHALTAAEGVTWRDAPWRGPIALAESALNALEGAATELKIHAI